jgi:CDP-diacylglycerol--glycerol-3-phosphate 3-phosphatidyltransferase
MWLILLGTPAGNLWAVLLLLVIAGSDIADGPIARRMNVVSPLGIFLDTSSDKVFVAGALVAMTQRNIISAWVVVAIIARDFLVSGLRSYAAAEGEIISARAWGKQKLILITVAIVWQLVENNARLNGIFARGGPVVEWLLLLTPAVWGLALFWTVLSGAEYLASGWRLLRRGWTPKTRPHLTRRPDDRSP